MPCRVRTSASTSKPLHTQITTLPLFVLCLFHLHLLATHKRSVPQLVTTVLVCYRPVTTLTPLNGWMGAAGLRTRQTMSQGQRDDQIETSAWEHEARCFWLRGVCCRSQD